MKCLKTTLCFVSLIFFLFSPLMTYCSPQSDLLDFQQTKEWKKLSEPLKQAWLDAVKNSNLTKKFKCFVGVQVPFDAGDRAFLEGAGLNFFMEAGAVVRGDAEAKSIPDIAKLPFVKFIKLAE